MMKTHVAGMDSINRRLAALEQKAAKKALRAGVTAGAKLLAKGAKQRVHRGKGKLAGLLRKSIGSKVKTFRGSGVTVGIIGPRKGFLHVMSDGRRVDPIKYGHIEERGRQAVTIRKKKALSDGSTVYGTHVAKYDGHPFMEPTIKQVGPAAEAQVGIATMRAINAEVAKTK